MVLENQKSKSFVLPTVVRGAGTDEIVLQGDTLLTPHSGDPIGSILTAQDHGHEPRGPFHFVRQKGY